MSKKLQKRSEYYRVLDEIGKVQQGAWYYYRDLLNDYEFNRNRGINRAYYKMWEMLSKYEEKILLEKSERGPDGVLRTCHLAEAPGSFVLALNDYLHQRNRGDVIKSIVTSKRPNRPTYSGGHDGHPTFHRSLYHMPNVSLQHLDLTNDEEMTEFINVNNTQNKFDLVTADGGIDEGNNYASKEALHHDLLWHEVKTILQVQKVGGNCIIKFFETFTEKSLKIMYYLVKHYKLYTIYKPLTSRPTNSERYLICHHFNGAQHVHTALDDLTSPPVTNRTYLHIRQVNDNLTARQCSAIKEVLNVIRGNKVVVPNERFRLKSKAFERWRTEFQFGHGI